MTFLIGIAILVGVDVFILGFGLLVARRRDQKREAIMARVRGE